MKKLAFVVVVAILLLGVLLDTNSEPKTSTQAPEKTVTQPAPPKQEPITPDTLFIEINKVRVSNSLQPFSRNQLLDKSSTMKCADMVKDDYYGHSNPKTGKRGYTYINDGNVYYDNSSENLNKGYFHTPGDVIKSWMGSPSHAASIVDPQFTEIGFSVCTQPSGHKQLTVVQHKINPYEAPQQVQSYNTAPRRPLIRGYDTTTTCTHNDNGGVMAPTTTCTTR